MEKTVPGFAGCCELKFRKIKNCELQLKAKVAITLCTRRRVLFESEGDSFDKTVQKMAICVILLQMKKATKPHARN